MKHTSYIKAIIFLFVFVSKYSYSQIQTEKLQFDLGGNKRVIFHVTNSTTKLDDSKEYYWHSENSGIQSTKGGNGGKLLHGTCRFYYSNGNMELEENFYLGLQDGDFKSWDKSGNLEDVVKYKKGIKLSSKRKTDDGGWCEVLKPNEITGDTVYRFYRANNTLIAEETRTMVFFIRVKEYFELTQTISREYTKFLNGITGRYVEYYSNGKIKMEGEYKTNEVKIGTWKYYHKDGKLNYSKNHN